VPPIDLNQIMIWICPALTTHYVMPFAWRPGRHTGHTQQSAATADSW